jgi:hypothetical protein
MKFNTKISPVPQTNITRVLLGHVCITFKGDTVIGIETPTESYSTEIHEPYMGVFAPSGTWRLRYSTWRLRSSSATLVTPNEIIILMNRMLKEQGETVISDELKKKFLGKNR